jgi:hypothetical protein
MGASWLLLDYDVVHFRHHINLDTGNVRLHIVVEPVLEVIPALPYLRYVKLAVYATWATNPAAARRGGVSCSDTLSYESVVMPETDNLTNTDMFAPLRVCGSCTAKSTLLTCTPSCARSVAVAGCTSADACPLSGRADIALTRQPSRVWVPARDTARGPMALGGAPTHHFARHLVALFQTSTHIATTECPMGVHRFGRSLSSLPVAPPTTRRRRRASQGSLQRSNRVQFPASWPAHRRPPVAQSRWVGRPGPPGCLHSARHR